MRLRFTKMHGIGNDYIYFNCFDQNIFNPSELSVILSDRHKGIGGDGIVMILPSDKADFKMRIFNADGSEAKMCGNGIRCVAKYVYDYNLTTKNVITVDTLSGVKTLWLTVKNNNVQMVTVDMGKPIIKPKDIPVNADGESFINKPITVMGKEYWGTAVSMGNPHFIIFTKGVKELDLEKIGLHFENHELFPDRVNTEFAEVLDDGSIYMRVWERGSGETLACGTGATATLAAAVLNELSPKKNTIHLLGGDLIIELKKDGHAYMTGPATKVFDGEFELDEVIKG